MFAVVLLLGFCFSAIAQTDIRHSTDSSLITGSGDTLHPRSSFVAGLKFSSDQVYLGRSDVASAPYLTASGAYLHRSGVFVRSAVSYLLVSEESRVDVVYLAAGYNYFGNRLSTGGFASGSLYSKQSYNVQAEMSAFIGGYVEYDLKQLLLSTDIGLGFSGAADFIIGLDLSRDFYLLKGNLLVGPNAGMNAGTQHYYYQYITNRSQQTGGVHESSHGHNNQSSSSTGAISSTVVSGQTDVFNILDYEAGLQLTYRINRLKLFAISTVFFPVNPVEYTSDSGTMTEDLSVRHVLSLGLRFRW